METKETSKRFYDASGLAWVVNESTGEIKPAPDPLAPVDEAVEAAIRTPQLRRRGKQPARRNLL